MNNKQSIIILCGISGSGKSTWSTNYIKQNPTFLRVNRDSIRLQLVGDLTDYYNSKDLKKTEDIVSKIIDTQISIILQNNFNVIIDNTHLSKKYINEISEKYFSSHFIEVKYFHCELNAAKTRVLKRDFNTVTDDALITDIRVNYIDKQFEQYKTLTTNYVKI